MHVAIAIAIISNTPHPPRVTTDHDVRWCAEKPLDLAIGLRAVLGRVQLKEGRQPPGVGVVGWRGIGRGEVRRYGDMVSVSWGAIIQCLVHIRHTELTFSSASLGRI